MASLTVRQLDDRLKRLLRLRAARNGRSMEDEVRTILRQAAQDAGREVLDAFEPPGRAARQVPPAQAPTAKRVLVIIGGGIAAYKSLDLIRRLQDGGAGVRGEPGHVLRAFPGRDDDEQRGHRSIPLSPASSVTRGWQNDRSSALSATEAVIGPVWSTQISIGMIPVYGTSPHVGFIP